MICSDEDVMVYLGIAATATDAQKGLVAMCRGYAEAAVKRFLGFDPGSATYTEFYPKSELNAEHDWFVDVTGNGVSFVPKDTGSKILILNNLPVTSVTEIREDAGANFGQGASDFPSSTILLPGVDYWLDLERSGICLSGIVYRAGAWSYRPGTIKVTYVSGYSTSQLAGRATGHGTIDASEIRLATIMASAKNFRQAAAQVAAVASGIPGALVSESLADYSYTADSSSSQMMTGMTMSLPSEVRQILSSYRSYAGAFAR